MFAVLVLGGIITLGHTESLCQEKNISITVNNLVINDSSLVVNSVPFTVTVTMPDTTNVNHTNFNSFDGCILDDIQEMATEQAAQLIIYPNPSEGWFTVEINTDPPIKTEIEIYNINGRKIYSGNTNESVTDINLTGNARGLYFLRMSNERFVKTGKVMVY